MTRTLRRGIPAGMPRFACSDSLSWPFYGRWRLAKSAIWQRP